MNGEAVAKKEVVCESCGSRDVKYRCPSCTRRTCSLQCVKEHKKAFTCTGTRCKTTFVSKPDYNYNNMINDYRFLEDTERVAYSASASQKQKQRHFNKQAFHLIKNARKSGVVLKLMPVGMSKRMTNTTYYNNRNRSIMWRVKWLFPQADSQYINPRVSENEVLLDLLKSYLDPVKGDTVTRQRLKPYLHTAIEDISIFLRKEYQPANQERYYPLNPSHTLKECLSGKTIIEFPTLYVVLPEKAHMYKIQGMQMKSGPSRQPSLESKIKLGTEESNKLVQTMRTGPINTEVVSEDINTDMQATLQNGQELEQTTKMNTEELNEVVPTAETEPIINPVLSEEIGVNMQVILESKQEPDQTTKMNTEELNEVVPAAETNPITSEVLSQEITTDMQATLQNGQEPEQTTKMNTEELNEVVPTAETNPITSEVLSQEITTDMQAILESGQEPEQTTKMNIEELNEVVPTAETNPITSEVLSQEITTDMQAILESGQEPEQSTKMNIEELYEVVPTADETNPIRSEVLSEEINTDMQAILESRQEPEQITQAKIEEMNEPVDL